MSTEWSVSFNYRTTDVVAGWTNIIHFTISGNMNNIGDRTPAVFVTPESKNFLFVSYLNNTANYYWDFDENIQQNHVYKIEIHQRYISNGNYRYFIKIDGDEVHSAINSKARQFYDVKVYAEDPWHAPSKGFISKFKFTNFL